MDYAVISDVHGNLEALDAVLADIAARDPQTVEKDPSPPHSPVKKIKILFLGDAVGYGPNPNECIAAIKKHASQGVAGNHDRAVLGLIDISFFNPYAREAIGWTDGVLSSESRAALEGLPLIKRMEEDGLFLVHGSPYEPERWHYLLYFSDAKVNFEHFKERICLAGHSHIPFIMRRLPSGEITASREGSELDKAGSRYIINAGSVGQPRDGDPRACYLLLNDTRAEFLRVPYDIGATQQKMRAAGLPLPLIERLQKGL